MVQQHFCAIICNDVKLQHYVFITVQRNFIKGSVGLVVFYVIIFLCVTICGDSTELIFSNCLVNVPIVFSNNFCQCYVSRIVEHQRFK